ncbi:succinate dehydrogenase subunit 3-1, mitochondrial-like [Coffea eugenioides]|uniref:succinate dehydrogenase subunit 3-1, mitochondrial-like n=1 Tax=Coffea eugenioides TaxID=49369 RepID=UPI000F604D9B|nr:succinate dehydrogenase subunit 3-1, mitochondrial-like [Coffea eugenioides]
MASSLALKRLVSSSSLLNRSLNPLLRPAASAASSSVFDVVDRRSDRPLDHRRELSSFPGVFDPFWRRSVSQFSEYSSVASGVGPGSEAKETGDGLNLRVTGKEDDDVSPKVDTRKNVFRPLSPHLPIYQPQVNSTMSILNRISGIYLSALVLSFYLASMKMGSICFSHGSFYQFFFYSSKLSLISAEIAALALFYHVYAGVRHLLMDVSGTVFFRRKLHK